MQGRGGQGGGGGAPEHHKEGDEHGRDGEEAREATHKAFGGAQGLCVPGGGEVMFLDLPFLPPLECSHHHGEGISEHLYSRCLPSRP